jgi:hypothetical protein
VPHRLVDELLTTAALNFIKINKPDQFNRYRPFFLYLWLSAAARQQGYETFIHSEELK